MSLIAGIERLMVERLKWLALASAIAILPIASSCWGYPLIDVKVRTAGNRLPAFAFGGCGMFARKPLIESVEVLQADHAAWNPSALCKLTVANRSKYEPLDQWVYGETKEHFVSSGSCLALAPGSYEVKVHGAGSGSAIIVVADDGQVREASPPCRP
jgi:hypothetical protein